MKTLLVVLFAGLTIGATTTSASAASCSFELQNRRGRVLQVVRGSGYDRQSACQRARRQCNRMRMNSHHNPNRTSCVKRSRSGNGGYNQYVTRRCSAELISRRGRTIQYFSAQAQGYRGNGVKAEACQKVARKCRRFKQNNGYGRARCEVIR